MLKEQFRKIGQKWNALQIDKCMWNYQTSYQCNNFECSRVRVHHKPMQPGSDHRECLKSKYKEMLVSNLSNPTSNHSERSTESSTSGGDRYHRKARFGFYFPVHDQVEGVVEVLKSTRYFYPEAPIFLLQDGGSVDFGPLCKLQRQENWSTHYCFKKLLFQNFCWWKKPSVDGRKPTTVSRNYGFKTKRWIEALKEKNGKRFLQIVWFRKRDDSQISKKSWWKLGAHLNSPTRQMDV